jgi:hypothetical protein
VELAPAQAVFGIVPVGQPVARQVGIRYHGNQQWQVTGVAANQTVPFDVAYQEGVRRAGLVDYQVTLTLKPDTPAGIYKGDVYLATNDRNNPTVPVPFNLMVQAPLTISPDTARFRRR